MVEGIKYQGDGNMGTLFYHNDAFPPGVKRVVSVFKGAKEEMTKVEKVKDNNMKACKALATYCIEGGGECDAKNLLHVLTEFVISLK